MTRLILILAALVLAVPTADAGPFAKRRAARHAACQACEATPATACPGGVCVTPCNCVDVSKCGPGQCPASSPYPLPTAAAGHWQQQCVNGTCRMVWVPN